MTKKVKTIILIFVVVLLGAGAYYYFQGGFVSAEEKIIQAEEKFRDLDSYTAKAEIDFNFVGEESQTPDMDFSFAGDVDRKEKAFQGEGEMNFELEGAAAKVGGSMTYIDDNLYGNVDTFPYLALPLESEEVSTITENNILIKEGLLKDVNSYLASYLAEKGKEPMTVEEIVSELENYSKNIWEEEVITVEKVEEDMFEGKKAKKYTLNFDGKKMTDLYIDLIEEYEVLDLASNITEEQKEQMKTQMKEEMQDNYEDIEAYGWIQDGYIVRMKVASTSSIEVDESALPEGQKVEVPEKVEVVSNIYYSNFDKDFDITAPEDYITLNELMNQLQIPVQLPEVPEEVESN